MEGNIIDGDIFRLHPAPRQVQVRMEPEGDKLKYMIVQRGEIYECRFKISPGGSMSVEDLPEHAGVQVLDMGSFYGVEKLAIVIDAVKDASRAGEFDQKALEAKLKE